MKLTILQGDVFQRIAEIPSDSIDLCITSPPYWGLRNYGVEGQLGCEPTMEKYLDNTMRWVKEVWRVLKPTGSFVLNIGDCFVGNPASKEKHISSSPMCINRDMSNHVLGGGNAATTCPRIGMYKAKQLLSVSSFAYCRIVSETDFVCRGEHIWAKPNVPSPIRSRLKHSHEKLFWFVKDANKYYFDERAWMKKVAETSNKRYDYDTSGSAGQDSIITSKTSLLLGERSMAHLKEQDTIEHSWRIIPVGEKQNGFELAGKQKSEHVAPYPTKLIEPYIHSLSPPSGTVLDPFLGSGTTMRVAMENGRNCIGIELNPSYVAYAKKRMNWKQGLDVEYNDEVIPCKP